MSVVAGLGIVLMVGFVVVALVACIAWRSRMRESMPYGDDVRRRRLIDTTALNDPERS